MVRRLPDRIGARMRVVAIVAVGVLESGTSRAGVTQLAECQLPKLNVAGSNPVSRSNIPVLIVLKNAPTGCLLLYRALCRPTARHCGRAGVGARSSSR